MKKLYLCQSFIKNDSVPWYWRDTHGSNTKVIKKVILGLIFKQKLVHENKDMYYFLMMVVGLI